MVRRIEGNNGHKRRQPQSLSPPVLVFLSPRPKEDMKRGFTGKDRGKGRGGKKKREKGSKKEESEKYMLKATPLTR